MRVLADHGRAMTFLIADGVVPSNEDRGYILRRMMRRAIQQGRTIGLESPFLGRFADKVIELMGDVYPGSRAERDAIPSGSMPRRRASAARSSRDGLLARADRARKREGTSWIDAEDAFRLHDTYGFPYDLTRAARRAGAVRRRQGFHELMEEQRERARMGRRRARDGGRPRRGGAFAREAGLPTRFVGYETTDVRSSVGALMREAKAACWRNSPRALSTPRAAARSRRRHVETDPALLASATSSVSATTRPWTSVEDGE